LESHLTSALSHPFLPRASSNSTACRRPITDLSLMTCPPLRNSSYAKTRCLLINNPQEIILRGLLENSSRDITLSVKACQTRASKLKSILNLFPPLPGPNDQKWAC